MGAGVGVGPAKREATGFRKEKKGERQQRLIRSGKPAQLNDAVERRDIGTRGEMICSRRR